MILSFIILSTVTLAVMTYAWRYHGIGAIHSASRFAADEGLRLAIRLPIALFAAMCLAELIPDQLIGQIVGHETGFTGILVASLLGGLMPGGPMVAFPMALVLAKDGAGGPQMVALITGWSVFAFHRVVAYEGPMMGWRFVALRFLASAFIPMAGFLAGALAAAVGASLSLR